MSGRPIDLVRLRAAFEPTGGPGRLRVAWILLAVAIAIYAAFVLWITRDSIPQIDGIDWFADALGGFDPTSLASPHNGHPLIPTRFLHAFTLEVFGPEQFVIQLFTVAAVAASSLVLFLLLRKRLDPLIAVAPPILVLFLGTTTTPVDPNISAFAQSAALGLGALLALEREDRRGDLIAFVLLAVGVLTFSLGLPFALGAGVLILLQPDWRRRVWIVVVPAIIFAAWFLWARRFGEGTDAQLENLILAPSYAFDNLAAAFAALSGLDREYVDPNGYGLIDLGWGRILAAGFLALVALAVARGRFTARALACSAILVAYWTLGALAQGEDRFPQSVRYVWVTAVLVAVVGYEVTAGWPVTRRVSIAVLAVLVLSLPINVDRMRYTGAILRQVSLEEAAEFTAIELQRDNVRPGLRTSTDGVALIGADTYLELADEHGSLATPVEELPVQSGAARARADATLGGILLPQAVEVAAPPAGNCERVAVAEGALLEAELPPGGGVLRADVGGPVTLRRFGDAPTVDAGAVEARRYAEILLPADESPQPWLATVEGAIRLEVCDL